MSDRRASNARYYERTRDRIILREDELTPHAIEAVLECLADQDLRPTDRRMERLRALYRDLTGRDTVIGGAA